MFRHIRTLTVESSETAVVLQVIVTVAVVSALAVPAVGPNASDVELALHVVSAAAS
jgi:hypothetical protein